MRQLTLTLIISTCFSVFVFGQDEAEKHPIEIEMEHCLSVDSNLTTIGMTTCVLNASEKWDKEMNRNYQLLKDELTEEQMEKLKLAQRQWLEFRDKELAFSYDMYGSMQGTMWQNVAASQEYELIKARTLELKVYYDMLTFDKEK